MSSHRFGRRRLAAAATLAVLGLLLATLGHASASQLPVEADGNLVWSRAWPDSPEPETQPMTGKAVCVGFGLYYFAVHWTILEDADQSLPYNVYLVTEDSEKLVPAFDFVSSQWWAHSHVRNTDFAATGWQVSDTPRDVYLVLRDGNGTSIDAVRVTVGATSDSPPSPGFLACTGSP